ncbi:uncharacterized protein LOC126372492 [Pectinophora gossypiella]|uniref:uncharacterized protein LOC126372492 n=1 Tax=Pectinophora gossypiella TaxID=13191 RepID=UPI00214F2564|nr:uncharacterized protein LOC126372492 [Pectinophora gossypiella]
MRVFLCVLLCALIELSKGVSTKVDFEEDPTSVISDTSTSKTDDEDVEVKHTIVVSTKLKNNNRRGITSNGNADGTLTYNIGQPNQNKDDSGEVPVIKSYKSVETTQIRTPDTRTKNKIYPDSIFVSRDIRDDADTYPNVIAYPMNWKPANFYHNINNWNPDNGRDPYSMTRRRPNPPGKIHRKMSDGEVREFYCKKCVELSSGQGFKGCGVQQRSVNSWPYETTTPKLKLDGKLAKLN